MEEKKSRKSRKVERDEGDKRVEVHYHIQGTVVLGSRTTNF